MQALIKYVQEKYIFKKEWPDFNSGDTITVYSEIKEGAKTRIQSFKGVVIQRRGEGFTETFTIRKMSGDIGVERVFVTSQPNIQNIEVNKKGKVRRARIYYFSQLRGKKARIQEKRSRAQEKKT
ncbi:50S ribosomal protein L19 [Bacteroidetes bacterium endosymbiont of Geopemphigus sp.]|uniref:50S ribosomal protein L19 n=1 Tax=Bacteroidetes bacterium endosymbiont of Geopemphigus sp. TaxID=2047937 RepID=UPI000CD11C54|nr:50S ribosomal protein L19 [Bacteroidetes bacterium endosymbiont of Geopemphigus sp.]